MSGHKRAMVKLNRQDLQRIEKLASQLRQVEYDYNQINKKIQDERQNQVVRINEDLQNRLEAFSSITADFHEQIGWIEDRTNQALIEQSYALQDQILSNHNLLAQNTNTLIEQHINAIHLSLQENQTSMKSHFDQLHSEIRRFRKENEQKFLTASDALQSAQALLESIDQVYDHERYYPGTLTRLLDQFELAVSNLHNEMPEAALAIAQQICQQASILRLSIEEIMQKTAYFQAIAIDKLQTLYEIIKQNAVVPAIDLEGNLLDVQIDVDFWTSGRWYGLLTRCEKFLSQVQSSVDDIDHELFDRILKFIIPQIEQSLYDTVSQARIKVILSQIRYNIAESVLDALAEQGFELTTAVYENQDERQPYQVVVRNLDGSEVHVNIAAAESVGAYSVQVSSHDSFTGTESEMRQRSQEIFNSLNRLGLVVGQPEEIKDETESPSTQQTFGLPPQRQRHSMQPFFTSPRLN